jgi:hypothetical protein
MEESASDSGGVANFIFWDFLKASLQLVLYILFFPRAVGNHSQTAWAALSCTFPRMQRNGRTKRLKGRMGGRGAYEDS